MVREWLQTCNHLATLHEDAEHMRVAMEQTERLAYTVTEAAALLGIGRTHAYALAKTGELPTVTLGRRVVVPKARLDAMLAGDAS
jgi:excisionase family DNA binding protein